MILGILITFAQYEKWPPKIGQHDKCLLGLSRLPALCVNIQSHSNCSGQVILAMPLWASSTNHPHIERLSIVMIVRPESAAGESGFRRELG